MIELIDRAAIELAHGDELVTRLQERMEDQKLCAMAGRGRERRRAAFERRDPLFEHRLGGVHDARIDVAECLQAKQGGGMLDIVEHEGRGLVDRRRARARRRVGLGASVNCQCIEAGGVV